MHVIVAEELGMCFGVKKALEIAAAVAHPERVTIHGELVHNAQVLADLSNRGFVMQPEDTRPRVPSTEEVMVTAHGISDRERRDLLDAGKVVHDTTCPLVGRVHRVARMLAEKGYFIVIIGRADHVEVRGIAGDLHAFAIAERVDDVRDYGHARLGVICQTTTAPAEARCVRDAIAAHNPTAELRFVDTICHPTKARQKAVEDLLPQVEALVVVGGHTSNNTRRLGDQAQARGLPWFHVQSADDIDPHWRDRFRVVGLTAGTSTPDHVIDAVHARLVAL